MAQSSLARRFVATGMIALAFSTSRGAGEADAQQPATVIGRVTTDSGRRAISYADIRIPELEQLVRADSAGVFRIEQLVPGTYVVIAESPGFRARRASVTLVAGETSVQDFVLAKSTHLLATVSVRAKAPPRVSPKMLDFERRRRRGLGRFVTRAELERVPGRQLEAVLRAAAAGTQFVKTPHGQTWLVSGRQAATNMGLLDNNDPGAPRNTVCYAQVVLDGAVISSTTAPRAPRIHTGGDGRGGVSPRSQVQGGDDPLDLNQFFSDQLEGVEYYPDATTTPMQYRTPAAVCGTLILWTRDR
jgi:hypothetical protein